MKSRYCWASAKTEILARSTFCVRASASRRSSGPSKPSTSTTRVSPALGVWPSSCSQSETSSRSSGASSSEASVAFMFPRRYSNSRDAAAPGRGLAHEAKRLIGVEGLRLAKLGDGAGKPLGAHPVKRRHDPGDLAHLVELAATVERDVAAGGDHRSCPLGHRSAKGLHADIVAHHQACQSDQLTNHFT